MDYEIYTKEKMLRMDGYYDADGCGDMTPYELYEYIYNKNGSVYINWNNFKPYFPGHTIRDNDLEELYDALRDSNGPVYFMVGNSSVGNYHASVLVGYTGDGNTLQKEGFQIIDVYNGQLKNLADFVNTVSSWPGYNGMIDYEAYLVFQ